VRIVAATQNEEQREEDVVVEDGPTDGALRADPQHLKPRHLEPPTKVVRRVRATDA
jgi:hypothetical protein